MENGDKTVNMVLARWFMPRRENIMDIGRMEGDMEKGFLLIPMEISIQAGGSLERKRVMELINSSQQTWNCLGFGKWVRLRVENGYIQMVCSMKENSRIINLMGQASGTSKMEMYLRENMNKRRRKEMRKKRKHQLREKRVKKELLLSLSLIWFGIQQLI